MKYSEVRHLDELKGNFGILDGTYYRATARVRAFSPPPLLLSSTVRAFVEQQEYVFDILWKKAIPALKRIKEIEDNLIREFIETIHNSDETVSLISKVISSATEEIQMVFSTLDTFKLYEKFGIMDMITKKADNKVMVRILIGAYRPIASSGLELLSEYSNIKIRYLHKSIQTKLTTIITDKELSLVIEDKENINSLNFGLTTYSNSDPTVYSYASMFENLWVQSPVMDTVS
jgi:hypothetical protein